MRRSAIVTGATSYIGIALINELRNCDYRVFAVIRPSSLRKGLLKELFADLDIVECELWDIDRAESIIGKDHAVDKADEFYHIGWYSDYENDRYNLEGQLINVDCSVKAMQLASNLGCGAFIGVGSQAECGIVNSPINSDTPDNPLNAYAVAKCRTYEKCVALSDSLGIRFYWPRLLSAYGPFARDNTLINLCINACINREPIDLTAGEQIWDFVHVKDVAKALRLIVAIGEPTKKYSIASGVGRQLREYIKDISEVYDCPDLLGGIGKRRYSDDEVMYLVGDISELKGDTGMIFDTDFKKNISEMKDKMPANVV